MKLEYLRSHILDRLRYNLSMNTKKGSNLRFIIFRSKSDKEFTGVCYDLAIIQTGNDVEKLQKELTEAALGYVKTVKQDDLPDYLLNQSDKLPDEYRKIFETFVQSFDAKKSPEKPKTNKPLLDPESRLFMQPIPQYA